LTIISSFYSLHYYLLTQFIPKIPQETNSLGNTRHLSDATTGSQQLGTPYFRQVFIADDTDDTTTEGKRFGRSVSMSSNGLTVAVSGMCTDKTSKKNFYRVKVFEEVDDGSWSQKGADIDSDKASVYLNDARADVSLSGDGLNVAVSTVYIKDRDSSLDADATPEGSVTVYSFNNTAWELTSTIDDEHTFGGDLGEYFGIKVSLDGTGSKVAIGVQFYDTPGIGNEESGRVSVCTLSDGACQFISTGTAGEHVGSSVMISSGSSPSCVVFGAIGADVNGADSGSVAVFCEPPDSTSGTSWVRRGEKLAGEAAGDKFGFSVAISSDSRFVAVGAKLNDPSNELKDAGHVRVFRLDTSSLTNHYVKIGNDIDGERGERSDENTGQYYVGDSSGYSIALSDQREDDTLRVAIGAPNNEGVNGYYSGHVRLYECDLTLASPLWNQVLYDIDGGTIRESAGYSIAASQDGTRIIFGSPNFENDGGSYYAGAAFVYEQTEYSAQPSDVPTTTPSEVPSISVMPTSVPSQAPSDKPTHSIAPSSKPSALYDQVFQITTSYAEFDVDSDWCLTASSLVHGSTSGSKIYVRRCDPTNMLQLWSIDEYSQLKLAAFPNNPSCITTESARRIFVGACENELNPSKTFTILDDEENANGQWIKQTKSAVDLYIGVDPERKFARTHLFRKEIINGSLNQWKVVYGFASAISSNTLSSRPSSYPTQVPSASQMPSKNNVLLPWSLLGDDIDGEAADDNSGWSVSLSSDGKTVAIGAYLNDGNGSNSGHTRVFQWNAGDTSTPGAWVQMGDDIDSEAADDNSGWSVSLSSDGKTVAIGARLNDGGNGYNSGHTRVFQWNAGAASTPGAWVQIGVDIDGEAAHDLSGWSVSLSSDGKTVAIGAHINDGNGTNSGHTRVFQWKAGDTSTPGAWVQMGDDIDGEAAEDMSGFSVSLSSDGKTVAIGAHLNDGGNGSNSGHVRVFQWNAGAASTPGAWVQMGDDIDGEDAHTLSGESVSLSSDGKTVAIGAHQNRGNGYFNGHTRVFQWNAGAASTPGAWVQMGDDIDGEAHTDQSGRSVSLSSDGKTIAIGAYGNDENGIDSGHTRVFQWKAGAASTPGAWVQMGVDIDGEAAEDMSGRSVSLSSDGKTVAIGAYGNDGNGSFSGHVRVYSMNAIS
jgi:hypothetical protein